MGETGGMWSRVRALPVGARVVMVGWVLLAVVGLPVALARSAGQTVETGSAPAAAATKDRATRTPLAEARASTTAPPARAAPSTTTARPSTTSAATTAPPTTAAAAPATTAPPPPPPTTAPPPTALPTTAPLPQPVVAAAPADDCHPSYDPCVPFASDVDCAGGSGNGPVYIVGPVRVSGSDPYGLDADGNGFGCEG